MLDDGRTLSVSPELAKSLTVMTNEAMRTKPGLRLRQAVWFAQAGRYWHGQVTSTHKADASVQLRDRVAIVPSDILTTVAPVTALLLQSVQLRIEHITNDGLHGLHATILDRVLGDAPDLPPSNDIAQFLVTWLIQLTNRRDKPSASGLIWVQAKQRLSAFNMMSTTHLLLMEATAILRFRSNRWVSPFGWSPRTKMVFLPIASLPDGALKIPIQRRLAIQIASPHCLTITNLIAMMTWRTSLKCRARPAIRQLHCSAHALLNALDLHQRPLTMYLRLPRNSLLKILQCQTHVPSMGLSLRMLRSLSVFFTSRNYSLIMYD